MTKKKTSSAGVVPVAMDAPDDKYSTWRVEEALRDLQRAYEHLGDSKMMGLVKKLAREKKAGLEMIEDMGKGVGERKAKKDSLRELVD